MAKSRAEKLAESTTFHPSWGSSKQTTDQGFTSSTGYTSIDYQSGQSEDPYKFARTRKMPRDVHPDVFVTPAWGSQIHQGSAFGEQPTWGSGIDYDPSKRHTIKDVTPGEERPSFLNVTALPDATDTSTEVKSEAISNWKVNAEKALQDMIKIEETDPSSRIQSVTPDPEPQIADEGVRDVGVSSENFKIAKSSVHKDVNIDNILKVGSLGLINNALPDISTRLHIWDSADPQGKDWVTRDGKPVKISGHATGPEPMDETIMPHTTTGGETDIFSGLYRPHSDEVMLTHRGDKMQPGDAKYHEVMHRTFNYLWHNNHLIKNIHVYDAKNKLVPLVDYIFPKVKDQSGKMVRMSNRQSQHDIIYSASKYPVMQSRVGHEEFGEEGATVYQARMALKKINDALKEEAKKLWVDPDV